MNFHLSWRNYASLHTTRALLGWVAQSISRFVTWELIMWNWSTDDCSSQWNFHFFCHDWLTTWKWQRSKELRCGMVWWRFLKIEQKKIVFWSRSRVCCTLGLSLFTSCKTQHVIVPTTQQRWRWWTTWTSKHHECHLELDLWERDERNCDNSNWIIFSFFLRSFAASALPMLWYSWK